MCYIRYILYIFLTVDVNILFGAPAHFQFKIRSVPHGSGLLQILTFVV